MSSCNIGMHTYTGSSYVGPYIYNSARKNFLNRWPGVNAPPSGDIA